MINPNLIIPSILGITLIISGVLIGIDRKKKRKLSEKPLISVLIPAYNAAENIENTLANLRASHDPKKLDIIIVNDKSSDNTLEILRKIKSKFNFRLINNKRNLGKAACVNKAFDHSRGEIVLVLDSDIIIGPKAISDILSRFESDERIGGVCCGYRIINRKGILPKMQDIEYGMLSFIQESYNPLSTMSLWGGCAAFRREAFSEIGKLSTNFIVEDMDSALKLQEHGWKTQQSTFPVYTFAPDGGKAWLKQKIRWSSGAMQNFIKHTRLFLTNPLALFYLISLSVLGVSTLYNIFIGVGNRSFIQVLAYSLIYPLFNLPYVLYLKDYRKNPLRILWVIPYSLIYYPIFVLVNLIGFVVGIVRYRSLSKGKRAW